MIIGLVGKSGSGKDTVAGFLKESGAYTIGLADPLKEFCKEVFDFSDAQLYGPSANRNAIDERWGITPRHALQTLGTDWGRSLHPDVWLRYAIRRAKVLEAACRTVVITDCRFQNEAAAIQAAGGEIWKIERPGAGLSGAAGDHASEQEIDRIPAHRFIMNDGSLEDLRAAVIRISR